MATYTVYMLEAQNISVSDGASLSGITQGDGSHLVGRTITLNSNAWKATQISDNDPNFDDNDTGQKLDGAQTIDGVTYPSGTVVEAEYRLVLRDPDTNEEWVVIGYNVNNSSPAYATVEGLAFIGGVGGFPPIGKPLTVIQATEGPGSAGVPVTPYSSYASPPCLTPGTLIATPQGARPIEALRPGDLVLTRDHGAQPLRWIGRVELTAAELRRFPQFRAIRIAAGSLGRGRPQRDLVVSPQHRILVTGWPVEIHFGEPEMLVAATHLVGLPGITVEPARMGVTYMHLLFDRHEVIRTQGIWTESLFAGRLDDLSIPPAARAELRELLARSRTACPPQLSRPVLHGAETAVLAGLIAA
jgi:hypothetical protein